VDDVTNLGDTLKQATITALRIVIYYEKLSIPFHEHPYCYLFCKTLPENTVPQTVSKLFHGQTGMWMKGAELVRSQVSIVTGSDDPES